MLLTRVATAVVLVPLVLFALFGLGPRGWAVVTLAMIVAAAHEWAGLVGFERRRWLLFVGGTFLIGFNLLFAASSGFDGRWPDAIVLAFCGAATVFWLFVAPCWLGRQWRLASPILAALLGWLLLLATWVAVVELQARSPWLALATMAIVWIADTAAYFSGRLAGRHRLAPSISPGKTWEGVVGALVAVAVYAAAVAMLTPGFGYAGPRTPLALAAAVAIAAALAAVSVLGDLFESLLKRQRGVKDSGRLLPGHGGVLDRIDALLAALPPAALLAMLLLR